MKSLPAAAHSCRADPPEQREAPTSKNPIKQTILFTIWSIYSLPN